MINIRSAFQAPLISKQHTLETYEHDKGRTDISVNCMEKSPTSVLMLISLGTQVHMQTIPAAPLLTPLSVQSSPSSFFFLDQTIDAAEKQTHKTYRLKDVPSLSGLDDEDDEVDDVSVDEERPLEKSHWSDDSDVDEDEDIEGQVDNEDDSGESVKSKTKICAKDKEADEEAFWVEGKEGIKASVVLEETGDEMAELDGNTHAGNARRLSTIPREIVPRSSIHDDVRE